MMMLSRQGAQRAARRAVRCAVAHQRRTPTFLRQQLGEAAAFFSSWPEHEILPMPALSPTMEQGNLGSWTLKVGDAVIPGNAVAEIETDKASVAFEAQDDGFIAALLHEEGAQDIAVGTPIAVVVADEDDVAAFANFTLADALGEAPAKESSPAPAAAAPPAPAAAPAAASAAAPAAPAAPRAAADGERVFASPLARKVAREAGVGVSGISGTGPNGRILRADVEAFLSVSKSLLVSPARRAHAKNSLLHLCFPSSLC